MTTVLRLSAARVTFTGRVPAHRRERFIRAYDSHPMCAYRGGVLPLHALFQRRIDGDDALLRLARLRFEQAGLAAEVYAATASELERNLGFVPRDARPPTVHLPRDLDLLSAPGLDHLCSLAHRFGSRVSGFVVHDHDQLPRRLPDLVAAGRRASDALASSGEARLFVEYAAGLPPGQFVEIGDALADVERVGLCVDTGHVGIRQARHDFARRRPDVDRDLAALRAGDPDLPRLVEDVQAAVGRGLETVLELTRRLAAQGKPVHFHLHDGHPLVPGLSDHYGFLTRLALPFRYRGQLSLDPLYGPRGLGRMIGTIRSELGPDRASMTLEIHDHTGRLPLPESDRRRMFRHWQDLANAERMNLWLRELSDSAVLVRALEADAP